MTQSGISLTVRFYVKFLQGVYNSLDLHSFWTSFSSSMKCLRDRHSFCSSEALPAFDQAAGTELII